MQSLARAHARTPLAFAHAPAAPSDHVLACKQRAFTLAMHGCTRAGPHIYTKASEKVHTKLTMVVVVQGRDGLVEISVLVERKPQGQGQPLLPIPLATP